MLRFNLGIYDKKSILVAIGEFSELGKLSFYFKKNYCFVKVVDSGEISVKVVENEFANYVLGLTQKCRQI